MSNASRGVFDPGAVHREGATLYRESDIALRYGLALKEALLARGIPVFMTRDDDRDPAPVGMRVGEARAAACTTFVSLHMNSVEDESATGTETLYRSPSSQAFAQAVQNVVVGVLGLRNRGIKVRTDLAVLRFPGPAALIELGFIANDRDRSVILQPGTRHAVCEGLADFLSSAREGARSTARGRRTGPKSRSASVRGKDDAAVDDDGQGMNDVYEDDADQGQLAKVPLGEPLFERSIDLTPDAFVSRFGEAGFSADFDMRAFEDRVRGWGLRYFSPAEFLYMGGNHYPGGSCEGRNGLPPQRLWANLEKTARMIDEVRHQFGHPIRISSAYRNTAYNDCVDGERASLHLTFNALDFVPLGGTLREMYRTAMRVRESSPIYEGGIGYYPSSNFVHIDTRGHRANW